MNTQLIKQVGCSSQAMANLNTRQINSSIPATTPAEQQPIVTQLQ
jgi:hypothetical protein